MVLNLVHSKLSHLSLRTKAEDSLSDVQSLILQAQKIVDDMMLGDRPKPRSGSGESFWQFRQYESGDRPADIDWKQSAKTDQVFIRQKQQQTAQSWFIGCDKNAGMFFSSKPRLRSKIESAQIISMAIALVASRMYEKVGLLGSEVSLGRSERHIQSIATRLLDDSNSLYNMHDFAMPQNGYVFLISDFLEPLDAIEQKLEYLSYKTRNICLIQILDPAEIELPYDGRITFKGIEKNQSFTIDQVEDIKDGYQGRIDNHIQQLENICMHFGGHYIQHVTTSKLRDTILKTIYAVQGAL